MSAPVTDPPAAGSPALETPAPTDQEAGPKPHTLVSPNTMLLGILAIVLLGSVAYVTRPVTVLVVLAGFLAILISPLHRWLQRYVTRWGALLVLLLGIGITLASIGLAFFVQARSIADKAPEYTERFRNLTQGLLTWAKDQGIELSWEEVGTTDAVASALGFVTSGLGSILTLAGQTLVVLIMMFFMLMEGDSFHDKFVRAFAPNSEERMARSLRAATRKVQRYIVTKTVVSLITGLLTWAITAQLGLDFAFIWGAVAFQLNFIPQLGSIIAVFPPALIALLQFDGVGMALITFFGLGSLQFTIGNIIEPRIMGKTLALSPTVVFMSLLFWGWFWGLLGVVLSVPLTAVIKIICEHVEALHPIALLLGDGTEEPASDH